jgi:hypothetical protein
MPQSKDHKRTSKGAPTTLGGRIRDALGLEVKKEKVMVKDNNHKPERHTSAAHAVATKADTPKRAEPKVEPKAKPKLDDETIDRVSAANARLAKKGETSERLEVRLAGGKPEVWWVNPVRLRKASQRDKDYLLKK